MTKPLPWGGRQDASGGLFSGDDAKPREDELLENAFEVLDEAHAEHHPVHWYALFSGGHDSLTACALAFDWARARGIELTAAHIRTGTGIPETTEFVEEVCASQDWPLRIVDPPVPYEDIVLKYGFPGPASHGLMYQRLKERCLRILVRDAKREFKDRVGLVTGVRADESVRRMAHVDRIQREGAQVWAATIWNWTKIDCARYTFGSRELPRNPVVDMLHMSGECLCGSFARPGEMQELEAWFPKHAAWLHKLELEVAEAGLRAYRWGQRPPRIHMDQMALDYGEDWNNGRPGMLCVGCQQEGE